MDYFESIKRAWQITYKHKFLWIFGLFIGLSGGASFNGVNFNQAPYYGNGGINTDKFLSQLHNFFFENLIIIIVIALFFILLLLFFVFAKIISQGALIGAVDSIEEKKQISFSKALKIGTKYFWKILGLNIIFGIIIFLCLMILGAPAIALFIYNMPGRGVLMMLVALVIFIPIIIIASFTITYALRFIVIRNKGVFSSIKLALSLLKNNLGPTILIYLILLGIGMAVSIISIIAILLLLIIIGIPLIILGIILYPVAGIISSIILALLGIILFLFIAFLISSVLNTYKSTLWTLTFRKLAVK